ncbi:hypothetical protein DKC15_001135 [Acinetobacter pittii]|nr:hypothetical protein DKC15_001135 [Acinetobacter pittii]
MFTLPSNIFQPLALILACLIFIVSKMPQLKYRKTILFLAIGSLTLVIILGIFGFLIKLYFLLFSIIFSKCLRFGFNVSHA